MRPNARSRDNTPFMPNRSWVLRTVGVALLACALAGAGFAIGLRAGSGQQPDAAGALQALLQRSGSAVVYSEFGDGADTVWAANPSDPNDRIAIGQAPHATGYGVFPSLSPDGKYVAYTAQAGAQADLWLLDVSSGKALRLTGGVDLQSAPVWSNGSDAVVVRRSSGGENAPVSSELLRVDLAGGVTTLASAAAGLYPIDFSPDGALYYASLAAGGTDLNVTSAGGVEKVAHLSDGIARDWALSPDGKRLAYIAKGGAAGFAANVIDVGAGAAGAAVTSSRGPEFHPVWAPDGTLTVGRLGELLDGGGATAGSAGSGFDVPLSWSPDGAYLIVRHFEGASTADPGPSWLWAIDANGQRRQLSDTSDISIAGWLEAPP